MNTNIAFSRSRYRQLIAHTFWLVLSSSAGPAQSTTSIDAETRKIATPLLSPSAQLMKEAFGAYRSGNWDMALEKANSCIRGFEKRALVIQQSYKSTNAPVIITPERVTDPATRKDILSRGPLNDVAGCYIVIGRTCLAQYDQEPNRKTTAAREFLKRAKQAFEKARTLTYAYVFDPRSPASFWRPSAKASEALSQEPLVSYQD